MAHVGTMGAHGGHMWWAADVWRRLQAKPLLEEALAARRETLGDRHPRTLISMGNLGDALCDQGHFDDAEYLLSKAAACAREDMDEQHLSRLLIEAKLARVALAARGDAEPLQATVVRIEAALGAEHHKTVKYAAVLRGAVHGDRFNAVSSL